MTRETADLIAEQSVEVEIRPGYSGRGMYGETTFAVTGDAGDVQDAILYAAYAAGQRDNEGIMDDLKRLRRDQLGMGIVVY